ncbi:MAG: hypothetical protein KDC53_18725 [Saprospiraceae bacterium]|nr:hypothetical protein [Saprospiraceae bacterium]
MKHPNLYFALLLIYILSACQKDLLDVNSGDSDADITFIGTGDHLSKVQENNAVYHEQETDYIWDAAAEKNIVLAGNSIESNAGDAVQIDGTIAEITTSGY